MAGKNVPIQAHNAEQKMFNFKSKIDKMLFTYIHGTDAERELMYEAFLTMAACADRELERLTAKQNKNEQAQT